MAEAALSALLHVTVKRLASPILEEFGLFNGLHRDIEKLGSTLYTILAVLKDAEEKQPKDNEVKNWLKKLKDAACDADDILDQCTTEALRRKLETEGRPTKKLQEFFSASNPVVFKLHMAHKIKDIRKILHDIAEERSKFHLREGLQVLETIRREKTDSFVIESDVYGRDEDKEKVTELLLNAGNEEEVSVIPIVGMAGLGKTTLAQQVYNDQRVQRHFNLKIWVCVSDFDVKRLTKAILDNATNSKFNFEDVDLMQRVLRGFIRGSKFLLVLDDVGDESHSNWERLKGFLRAGAIGSKVIVTTRSEKVASIMGSLPSHYLGRLSDDDCWSVFKRRAFGQGRQENTNLVRLGKEIVKKCGGVPLIAKALGGLMHFKAEESEWRSVKENEIWNILEQDGRCLLALRLSYYHLPAQLKECFAYCSVFPKDHQIYKEELILMWVAEGVIQPSRGSNRTEEEIGRECFNNLLWRSFFQDAEKDDDGNVISCKMHDIMRDLAQSVSVDACSIVNGNSKASIPNGCRRLSFDFNSREAVSAELKTSSKLKKLRALLLLKTRSNLPPLYNFSIHLPLCLRVLDLGDVELNKYILNSISLLKQLRYLHLSLSNVQILPSSFSKLHNLQTLRLRHCSSLKELPRDMSKMTSLRHLDIDEWISLTHMPAKMGELTLLQTLKVFIVGKEGVCNITELRGLNQLKGQQNIEKLENVRDESEAQEAELGQKENLAALKFSWSSGINEYSRNRSKQILEALQPHHNLKRLTVENFGGRSLPHWMGRSCLNLVHLSLINCGGCEEFPSLGQLPLLKFLQVRGMHVLKCIGSDDFYGCSAFLSVEKLTIEVMPNLEKWSGSNCGRAFPRLKKLTVSNCPKLTVIICFPLLSSLEEVTFPDIANLKDCPKCKGRRGAAMPSFLPSLRSLRMENFQNAKSIPSCLCQSRTHLSRLEIADCPKLQSLPRGLGNLATLEELSIKRCGKLASLFLEDMQNCPFLRHLTIDQCDGLTSLRLHSLTSLTHVFIQQCEKWGISLVDCINSMLLKA